MLTCVDVIKIWTEPQNSSLFSKFWEPILYFLFCFVPFQLFQCTAGIFYFEGRYNDIEKDLSS